MACGNCTNCGDSSKGGSQRSLVAYIQPCGASPANLNLNAMDDGNFGSNIKVTAGKRNIRGTRTTKYRRQSDGTVRASHITESTPDNHTLTLEFAQQGCGGYSPEELAAEGTFDIYNFQACCGAAEPTTGWQKCHCYRCVSFNDITFSDEASYNTDDDNDLTNQFSANYFNDYFIYALTTSEITGSTGIGTGVGIYSMVYRGTASGCSSNCKDDCSNYWYAVTDTGKVLYRRGSSRSIQSVAIPAFIASTNARIGIVGDRLVVATFGSYWTTTLDSYETPGTWSNTVVANMQVSRAISTSDGVYIVGNTGGNSRRIWKVDKNGAVSTVYTTATVAAGNTFTDYDECNNKTVAVGNGGFVLIGSSCGSLSAAPVSPGATNLNAVAIQPGGNIWVGDSAGVVKYSSDSGNSWTTVTLPATTVSIRDIHWVDQGVGYILESTSLFSTVDGGANWSASGTDKRVSSSSGVVSFSTINAPCCTSTSKEVNNIMITGVTTGNVGALWQGTISTCS